MAFVGWKRSTRLQSYEGRGRDIKATAREG